MATFLTNAFHPFLTSKLGATVAGQGIVGWFGWGNGGTPASALLGAISGEQGSSRASTTLSQTTTATTNDTLVITGAVLTAGSAFTLTQVGLLDATTSGNLLLVADVSPTVALSIGDTLRLVAQLQII